MTKETFLMIVLSERFFIRYPSLVVFGYLPAGCVNNSEFLTQVIQCLTIWRQIVIINSTYGKSTTNSAAHIDC